MKTILALLFLAFSFLSFAGEDIPAPKGVVGDPETIADAARVDLPSRTEISLNGLWRSRPIVDDEPADVVPAGDWGWAKIPAFLTRDGVGSALEDQETVYAPRDAVALYDPKGLTKANLERLGVPFRAVAAPEELAKTPGVVVVGREALTRELWEHALLPLVVNRRTVVVFE